MRLHVPHAHHCVLLAALALVGSTAVATEAGAQPEPASHEMFVGYGSAFVRGTDTSLHNEVAPLSTMFLVSPCDFETSTSTPTLTGCHQAKFQSLLASTFAGTNRRLYVVVGDTSYLPYLYQGNYTVWDDTLNALTPYWSQVQYIEVLHEPKLSDGWTLAKINDVVAQFEQRRAARGLAQKPLGVTYDQLSLTASSSTNAPGIWSSALNFVGIEGYVNPPGGTDSANKAALDTYMNGAKNQLGVAGKSIVVWGQAYNRNGQWTDVDTLGTLQDHIYANIAGDSRVVGLIHFAYYRDPANGSAGTSTLPTLFVRHQGIYSAITGLAGAAPIPDYNNDNRSDLADFEKTLGNFWIRLNTGAGGGNESFVAPGSSWGSGTALNFVGNKFAWRVVAGDFTGDGVGDFADVWHSPSGPIYLWVHAGNGNGSFQTSAWSSGTFAGGVGRELVPVDIDGDDDADVIVHELATGAFALYRNDRQSGFTLLSNVVARSTSVRNSNWRVLFADFDGDGRGDWADMCVTATCGFRGRFWIHHGNGDGTFSSQVWGEGVGVADAGWTVLVGDFTGDGVADFADLCLSGTYAGYMWVHENSGSGGANTFATSPWGWGRHYMPSTPWLPLGQRFR